MLSEKAEPSAVPHSVYTSSFHIFHTLIEASIAHCNTGTSQYDGNFLQGNIHSIRVVTEYIKLIEIKEKSEECFSNVVVIIRELSEY